MNWYDISEESYKNGYEKGYKDGKKDLLKMVKVTYCTNTDCPYDDCYKHFSKVKEVKEKGVDNYVNLADFSGVCRKYISYLVDNFFDEKE